MCKGRGLRTPAGLSEDEEFETFVVRVPSVFRSHVVPNILVVRDLMTSSDRGHPWKRPIREQFRTPLAYRSDLDYLWTDVLFTDGWLICRFLVTGCPSGRGLV